MPFLRRRPRAAEAPAAPGSELSTLAERQTEPSPPPPPLNVVNVHTPELAAFGTPPATWSADGVAVTGHDGWVFLGRGSNAILEQYQGAFSLPEGFDEAWDAAMAARREGAAALGAAFTAVIVPDKLAVLADRFPDPLPHAAQAPGPRLAARAELGLMHPVAELAAVPDGAFLRTDTHLSYAGNAALAAVVAADLGAALPGEVLAGPGPDAHRYVMSGDLGSRFSPPIVEIVTHHGGWGPIEVIASNREELEAQGRNVGTRQVLRNPQAADGRTLVLFGDSYAIAGPGYAGLAWFLAHAFREVHFLWTAFGWDPDYARAVGAEAIVCEGSERFVIRPPDVVTTPDPSSRP